MRALAMPGDAFASRRGRCWVAGARRRTRELSHVHKFHEVDNEVHKTKFTNPVRTGCVDFICELPAPIAEPPVICRSPRCSLNQPTIRALPRFCIRRKPCCSHSSIGVRSDLWHSHMRLPSAPRGWRRGKGCVCLHKVIGLHVAHARQTHSSHGYTRVEREKSVSVTSMLQSTCDFIPGCREPFLELSSRV